MAKEKYCAPRGTEDLLPEQVAIHTALEALGRRIFSLYGYREIRTPLFEETRLFVRSIGEVTDVVEKEMFTVSRGDEKESYSFRPEGTASAVRAYLEHSFDKRRPFQKFFYVGPMFRYEKPQKGRQRQFTQLGIEALGARDPRLDAEVIHVAMRFFAELGLTGLKARINSIGDRDDRDRFRQVLKDWFAPKLEKLCPLCQDRYNRNVFRVLDCKVETCRREQTDVPRFLDHLRPESLAYFEKVQASLTALGCPYVIDPAIVRGFDYYTHTVFEIPYEKLGARSALCGGGRYDRLINDLGGPELGSIGFSIGMTPTLIALEMEKLADKLAPRWRPDAYVITLGEEQEMAGFKLVEELRLAGFTTLLDYEGKSLRAQMKLAGRGECRSVLILGEDELARGVVKARDLDRSEDHEIAPGEALFAFLQGLRSNNGGATN